MKWGHQLKSLLEIEQNLGSKPRGLQERPELRQDCLEYLNTYRTLAGARQYSQVGGQALQVSEIVSYLGLVGGGVEEKLKTLRLVQALDGTYLDHQTNKQAQTNNG